MEHTAHHNITSNMRRKTITADRLRYLVARRLEHAERLDSDAHPTGETHPFIMTVGGPSASGKTTLLTALKEDLGDDLTVITSDDYYLGKTRMDREMPEGEERNFDHPAAINLFRLHFDLFALAGGKEITTPIYDMMTSEPSTETRLIKPTRLIIAEGLAVNRPEIRLLADLAVSLYSPLEQRLARRIARDQTRKGQSPEAIRDYYLTVAEPTYERYYKDGDQRAHYIVDTSQTND